MKDEKNQTEKIKYYYNENQSFYDFFWMNKKNLAMHYGYWDENTKNRNEALFNENTFVAKALNLVKDDVVLDAGCGVGGTSIYIAEKYDAKVVGISLMENQIEAAKKYAVRRKVENSVAFEIANYNNTKFDDNSFTKILAIESACHSENKEEFIKEAYRLLKPGGKLVVCDYFVNKLKDNNDEKNYKILCEGWAMANLSKKTDSEIFLSKCGFIDLTFSDYTNLAMRSSKFMRRIAMMWVPIDFTLNLVKIVSDQNFISTKASVVQNHLFESGALLHGIFSATKPLK